MKNSAKRTKKNHRILIRLHHINSHARTHNKITAFSIDSSPKAFELQFFFDAIIAVENALCCWRAQLSSVYKYMYTSELQCNVNISTNFLSAEFRNVRARGRFCSILQRQKTLGNKTLSQYINSAKIVGWFRMCVSVCMCARD